MHKFNTALVAKGLIAYAIERRYGWEQRKQEGAPTWMEQRRLWTDAILQGMARLEGKEPDPKLMEQFDHELEQARSSAAIVPASVKLQKETIRDLRCFVSALKDADGDRRRQVDVVWKLLEDMSSHLPWARQNNGLDLACGEAEHALRRMTAQFPIRFTRVLLGGDAGPHWASGYASGAVTDTEAVKRTAIYQEAVRDYPEIKSWPALCTVYVGRNLSSAWGTADACAFDLEIMNRVGDRFLKEPGVRWVSGAYQMTIPVELAAAMQGEAEEESGPEEMNPLLLGERALEADNLAVFERFAVEGSQITFCLDVLVDEKTVFGRQLSDEREDSYIIPYVVYDEDTGAVQDTMDVELRLPHDEKWFHCQLSSEVREALKEKLDAFCMERYGEHLPGALAQDPSEPEPSQTGPAM